MMNVVALCLVLSSLVTAGVWSPSPPDPKRNEGEDVIVKEGHRVVVVEYEPETEKGNTKVSISPHETQVYHKAKDKIWGAVDNAREKAKEAVDDAKEKAKEAASVLPNIGQGVSGSVSSGRSTSELVCDAWGTCKHKIGSAMGKAKGKVSEAAHGVAEKTHEGEGQAKEAVSEAMGKTKDTLSHKTDEISGKAHQVKEETKDSVKEVSHKAKDTISDKARSVGEDMKEAVDTSKTIGKDAGRNVSTIAQEAEKKAEQVKDQGEKDLGEIFVRGRELVKDILNYLVSPRTVEVAMAVVHLLGFATAYGMCMWVTFVSSYVLAGALPRQQFGIVQSKVYPVYFRTMAYSVMVALVGHLYGQRKRWFSNTEGMFQGYCLLGSFFMLLFNLLYLEPRATKVMFERMKMEKEEGRGRETLISEPTSKVAADHSMVAPPATPSTGADGVPQTREKLKAQEPAMSQFVKLSQRLKKLNAYSSLLNILTLMALTWHLVYLGQRLHVAC